MGSSCYVNIYYIIRVQSVITIILNYNGFDIVFTVL